MSPATALLIQPAQLPRPSHLSSLAPSPTYDVTGTTDKRGQTLKRLLLQGHDSLAPLREPKLILHSHLPHLLGSAYILGASSEQLQDLYSHEVTTLVHIDDTFVRGNSISRKNWRSLLGQKSHTVAFVDFFDSEITNNEGDWKSTMREYLFSGPEPLLNGLVGGLGHPFIHLAYAWELQSSTVAAEGLSLACTEYIPLHSVLDNPPPDNSSYKTGNLAEVLSRVKADERLGDLFASPGITNIETLLESRYDVLLEHWNAWEVNDPLQQLEQCCDISLLLGLGTSSDTGKYDFYLIHLITVAQAIRVLWHFIPEERHTSVMRQYALFFLLVYICQIKPELPAETISCINSLELEGRDWSWVQKQALDHRWAKDSHFFKVVRAPKVFEDTFGVKDSFYLKASVKLLTEFDGWEGFGEGVAGFHPEKDGFHPDKE